MKDSIKDGDLVKLLPIPEIQQLFDDRCFYSGKLRNTAASSLGGRIGIVEEVQQKLSLKYILFTPENDMLSWSIPIECVSEIIKTSEINKIEE